MSRRGASLPVHSLGCSERRFDFREVGALGRPVVEAVRRLRAEGLSSAEVCSLLAQAAAVLAQERDGLSDRQEWLALASELFDETALREVVITMPGGSA